jgi:hypothetical protein
LVLDRANWAQEYDRDFTDIVDTGERLTRGGLEYRRPYGWKRYAIKVIGKYEDDVWLGSSNGPNEWPVSYHGTGHGAAKSIAQTGYDLTKHTRHAHGRGIYSTPDINGAIGHAKSFTINAQEYLVILQNRVNPKTSIKLSRDVTGVGELWISPNETDIRPYGICIKKKS